MENLKEMLQFQQKALKIGKIIPGLNAAQSKEWREKKIQELKEKIDAQTGKKLRRKAES